MHNAGIYQIRNKVTGAVYVGSSTNIEGRLSYHRFRLVRGTHTNKRLQRAWQQWDYENFGFEPIERINSESSRNELTQQLQMREQFHIDTLQAYDMRFGYNAAPKAGRLPSPEEAHERFRAVMREVARRPGHNNPKTKLSDPIVAAKVVATRLKRGGYHLTPKLRAAFALAKQKRQLWTPEANRKRSESMQRAWAEGKGGLTPEHQAALSKGGEATRFKSGPRDPEQEAKRLANLRAAYAAKGGLSAEHIAKISAANKGRKFSAEHRAKLSAAHKGKNKGVMPANLQAFVAGGRATRFKPKRTPPG